MVRVAGTQCCAVMEMWMLAYAKSSEEAVKAVCATIWQGSKYYPPDYTIKPAAFYTFTGVEAVTKSGDPVLPNNHFGYASELAKYIQKHKLGKVVESPGRLNRVNHPTHRVKIFIWAPSIKALTAWYQARMSK